MENQIQFRAESLFQNSWELIFSFPFENKHQIIRIRRELKSLILSLIPNPAEYRIRTKRSTIEIDTYLRFYTRSLFDSMRVLRDSALPKGFINDFNELYHGTTTEFLPEIRRNGLLLSKAGKVWNDCQQKVFLTRSLHLAEYYAIKTSRKFGGRPVILRIDLHKLPAMILTTEKFGNGTITVFDRHVQYVIDEIISNRGVPAASIRNWFIFPEGKSIYILINILKEHFSKSN